MTMDTDNAFAEDIRLSTHIYNTLDQTCEHIAIPPLLGQHTASLQLDKSDYGVCVATIMLNNQTCDISAHINEIACLGAKPAWFMGTLLMPAHNMSASADANRLWETLTQTLLQHHIKPIAAHVTYEAPVQTPVVVGHMMGQAIGNGLLDRRNANAGDRLLLCQPLGLAGTAELATEHAAQLASCFSDSEIATMQAYQGDPNPCVWPIVQSLLPDSAVVGLFAPTHRGLADALHQIANQTHCGLHIQEDALPILPNTQRLCTMFGLDPLQLNATGSLLIICRAEFEAAILTKLDSYMLTQIGTLTDNPTQRLLLSDHSVQALEQFDQA